MSDTAELIAQKCARVVRGCATDEQYQELVGKITNALAAQAQEIERLNEKTLQYEINSRDRMHIIAVRRAEAAEARARAPQEAKPLSEWHEDIGPVLWWRFPVQEPPYVGTPLDAGRAVEVTIHDAVRDYKYTEHIGGWPGHHTHWTPLPDAPREPQL
jgi:hypothetical protein